MKIMVIYDSAYGNTEQIARAIFAALGTPEEVAIMRASSVNPEQLHRLEMVVVGAPTNGGRPMPSMLEFLNKIPGQALQGMKIAAFDTRMTNKLVGIFGYAAGKIADSLTKKGGTLVAPPEGFFVKGAKGPLKDGEFERAAGWAKAIAADRKAGAAAK
jgi:flavodoxin I